MFISRVLAIGALLGAVACSGSTPTAPTQLPPGGEMPHPMGQTPMPSGTVGVTIQDFTFSPASVTIKVGGSVRWTNNGPSAHTTTSDMGVWGSGILNPTGTFTFTFMQAGTFPYHCSIHPPSIYPGFVGSVTVTQ